MISPALYSSKSCEWSTPDDVFHSLDQRFNFTLDPCSTDENCKCFKHYTIKDNGLNQSWENETVFCNPPYGKDISLWVWKCYHEWIINNITVVLLIPSRTDTKYFHDYILPYAKIYFIKGRLRFGGSKSVAPFPSMVCIYERRAKD